MCYTLVRVLSCLFLSNTSVSFFGSVFITDSQPECLECLSLFLFKFLQISGITAETFSERYITGGIRNGFPVLGLLWLLVSCLQ